MLRSTGVPDCKQLKLSMTTESCLHPGTFSPKLRICTQPPANRSLPTASRNRQTGSYEHPSQGQQQGRALSQYQEYSSGARPPCTSRCAFQPFEAQGLGPLLSASQRCRHRSVWVRGCCRQGQVRQCTTPASVPAMMDPLAAQQTQLVRGPSATKTLHSLPAETWRASAEAAPSIG